jgi:predicted negative regulator of RcsB-dependent stress response
MKPIQKLTSRGEANSYYIVLGVLITVLVIFSWNYYTNHRNDVTVHPPHIDVH